MGLKLEDLPKIIKLGPHQIRVKIDPELSLREDRFAKADHRYNEIIFAGTIPEGRVLAETVLHEVLHHVGHIYGAKLEFQDEELINRLDKGLLDFLVHNKQLVRLLLDA